MIVLRESFEKMVHPFSCKCSFRNVRSSTFSIKLSSNQTTGAAGGSPGLVVMGGDSCSKGRGFESQHRLLDGHFSHLFVVIIVKFV